MKAWPKLVVVSGLSLAFPSVSAAKTIAASAAPAKDDAAHEEARAKRDIAFSPLAMPMMSGPGSIAVTIGFTSLSTGWLDYVAIILGILIVAVITYGTLRLSERVVGVIGLNGMNALSKVMGFLILCIGIQFVVNGVRGVVTDPELLRAIRDAF